MSQHYLFIKEKKLVAMLGWDKPIQAAYLSFGYLSPEGDDWQEPLLIHYSVPFDRINNIRFVDEIVISFAGLLERFHMTLPRILCDALIADIRDNTVNKMCFYPDDTDRIQLSESPFSSGLFLALVIGTQASLSPFWQ